MFVKVNSQHSENQPRCTEILHVETCEVVGDCQIALDAVILPKRLQNEFDVTFWRSASYC